MTSPRRQLIRPPRMAGPNPRHQRRLTRCREQLAKEQAGLDRWMTRLRRALRAFEQQQQRISRLSRRLAQLQATCGSPPCAKRETESVTIWQISELEAEPIE